MPDRKPVVFKAENAFCTVKSHELAKMKKLSDIKLGFDEMLRDLKPLKKWEKVFFPGRIRKYVRNRARLEMERDVVVKEKKAWWVMIKAKYHVEEGVPAILQMRTGNIILGVPQEGK